MKRSIIAILVVLAALCLVLTGCRSSKPNNGGEPNEAPATTTTPPETTTTPPTTETVHYDFHFELNADGESYTVTGYWGDLPDLLEIPAYHEGKPVTVIGQSAFASGTFTGIVIPETVHTIENNAFYCCPNLTSVTIPGTVKTVEYYAFHECPALAELTIEEGVEIIDNGAFQNCDTLTQVTIPGSVAAVGRYAFQYCKNLQSVVICDGVGAVGDVAFASCPNLTQVDLPDSGEISLYPSAFDDTGCKNDPANWEKGVFYLDNYLMAVDGDTFPSNDYPTVYTVREGTISIADEAFFSINATVYQIRLPDTLKYIGYQAFTGTRIDTIYIPGSVRCIAEKAFLGCHMESVQMAEGIEYIGTQAFGTCANLTSISFPASVTYIGEHTIDGTYITAMEVRSGNSVYHSAGNCIIETATGTLILGCGNSTIPAGAGVKHIGANAFSCKIESIVIPEGVISIGANAFSGCYRLKTLTLPSSLERIETSAFEGCRLTQLTIPASVNYIGNNAFYYCQKLEKLVFENTSGWTRDGEAVDMSDMSAVQTLLTEYSENTTWTRAD